MSDDTTGASGSGTPDPEGAPRFTDKRRLDPETGEKLVHQPEQPAREVLDPRWAALEGFTPDSEKN